MTWRTGEFRRAAVAGLAAWLLAGCNQGAAQDAAAQCAPPKPWLESNAKPGQPVAELAACLKDQAYQIRTLSVPVVAAANGIVAQCEIRVDRFEGVTFPNRDAASEQETLQLATADVTQARQCVGR